MESNTKIQNINKGAYSKYKHTLMMVLSCLIPLVILGILWVAGVSQNILSFGVLLLCPIMHLVMMKNMKHEHDLEIKKDNDDNKEELT